MLRKSVWAAALVVLSASGAYASDPRAEASLNLGYTGSNGIQSTEINPSAAFFEIRPKSSFFWGIDFGYFVNDRFEIGALYAIQKSGLQYTTPKGFKDVGEGFDVQNIMGTFTFNTGDMRSRTRFYLLGGFGATRFGNVTIIDDNGSTSQVGGKSKFATTWGAGVKMYPSDRIGWKLGIRWTPTNLGDTADEWICGGGTCLVTGTNTQYSHQVEFSGGVTIRF